MKKLTAEEKAEAKKNRLKNILYFIDEFSILLASVVAVISSEVVFKAVKGQKLNSGDIQLNWLNVIISSMIAVITYGSMYTKFKPSDAAKPPYIKRLANALLQGIAWRSLFSLSDK